MMQRHRGVCVCVCVFTIKAEYVKNSVSPLAIGGPLQQTGRVSPNILRSDVQALQSLNEPMLTDTVVALGTVVGHKPATRSTTVATCCNHLKRSLEMRRWFDGTSNVIIMTVMLLLMSVFVTSARTWPSVEKAGRWRGRRREAASHALSSTR